MSVLNPLKHWLLVALLASLLAVSLAIACDAAEPAAAPPADTPAPAAAAHWRTLKSDAAARYDIELTVDAGSIAPQVTWGTNPADVLRSE